ncbi:MAG: hypothetical protein M0R03_22975 [Novosphingobium sp.]|nr:hypothetical protein [Novosphingobium sp.]
MDKFKTVIDGKVISDSANAVGGYDYVGYVSGKGSGDNYSWLIRRSNVAGTEYRYCVGSSVKKSYDVAWTNKAILNYSRMDKIKTGQ